MEALGRRLVADGRISRQQLDAALSLQRTRGGHLGRHLVATGAIDRDTLFAVLAEHWHLRARSLVERPPDPALLAEIDLEAAIERGWIPCEVETDGAVVVAASARPGQETVEAIEDEFPGRPIHLAACSQRDLDQVVLFALRQRGTATGAEPEIVSRDLVRPAHHLAAGMVVVVVLLAAGLVPATWLAVAVLALSALFLAVAAAELSQSLVATASLDVAGERSAAQAAALKDEELPVYTVLSRVRPGEGSVERALGALAELDYPPGRLDAIVLVSEADERAAHEIARAELPEWVRVAPVPASVFADPVRACDHALVLARGPYVVAYESDDHPAPDQLRRAVAAFEADLFLRMERAGRDEGTAPLLGLRVARRSGSDGTAPFSRLTALDDALHLDHASGDRSAGALVSDHTSTHFNLRLLRRYGGFGLARWDPPGAGQAAVPARIETLVSSSVRDRVPRAWPWISNRSQAIALSLLHASAQVRSLVQPRAGGRPRLTDAVAAFAMPLTFATYPVVLVCGLALVLRGVSAQSPFVESVAWFCMIEALAVLATAAALAGAELRRSRGWRSAADTLALPAHWLLHGFAAWAALVAVASRAPRAR